MRVRADSFVVKTDVHYPTDSNLLYDTVRKIIHLSAKACKKAGLSVFRQSKHNLKKVKYLHRKLTKVHHSTSRDPRKWEAKQEEIKATTESYLKLCRGYVERAKEVLNLLKCMEPDVSVSLMGYQMEREGRCAAGAWGTGSTW